MQNEQQQFNNCLAAPDIKSCINPQLNKMRSKKFTLAKQITNTDHPKQRPFSYTRLFLIYMLFNHV